jgi:hypothetical protein
MDKSIIGKMAKIDCLPEQLISLGIHELVRGSKVKIIGFDVDHVVYGEIYRVSNDGLAYYFIPLKWLIIQK